MRFLLLFLFLVTFQAATELDELRDAMERAGVTSYRTALTQLSRAKDLVDQEKLRELADMFAIVAIGIYKANTEEVIPECITTFNKLAASTSLLIQDEFVRKLFLTRVNLPTPSTVSSLITLDELVTWITNSTATLKPLLNQKHLDYVSSVVDFIYYALLTQQYFGIQDFDKHFAAINTFEDFLKTLLDDFHDLPRFLKTIKTDGLSTQILLVSGPGTKFNKTIAAKDQAVSAAKEFIKARDYVCAGKSMDTALHTLRQVSPTLSLKLDEEITREIRSMLKSIESKVDKFAFIAAGLRFIPGVDYPSFTVDELFKEKENVMYVLNKIHQDLGKERAVTAISELGKRIVGIENSPQTTKILEQVKSRLESEN